ncbi:hypothetical protein OO17_19180 [Rhodopseudomonas palustris]|uniref:Uncharacterized protein n=2 Tax=Nitrobacteraceae TaxID=41294 RepID=A0A0D7EGF4_RHOPL|nr:hypothetical protein OO17_19180 [Rhodopseudomonas palustris]
MLHTEDGRAFYLNRQLEPAFFDPGEVSGDIDRLSRAYREKPHLISMPQTIFGVTGVIATWGNVTLEPLDPAATAMLASGRSPGGILVDFIGHFQNSIRQDLPVYRVSGGDGFVWAESHDSNGRGQLRFFAIDPSALASPPPNGEQAGAREPPVVAADPWKECQASDIESRLAGCTKVIESRGADKIRLADAFDGRCSANNQKQNYQPALSDCKTAIDLNPNYSYAYANLGATYLGLNDPNNALAALNKAIALKPNFVWSRLTRAKALEASGAENSEIIKEYQYALLIDPTNPAARDGITRLRTDATAAVQDSASCLGDTKEQARLFVVNVSSPAAAMEQAVTAISASAQGYREKLLSQQSKVDKLAREKEEADKWQESVAGSSDERKKILLDVQRLSQASDESRARQTAIADKIAAREGLLSSETRRTRQKEIREELKSLRAQSASAERDAGKKALERDEAISRAQRKSIDLGEAVARADAVGARKESAESCVRQIQASIDALELKAGDIRQKQKQQADKALQEDATNLLSDLSQFAQKSSNLVPLEIGPLVASLKAGLSAKDLNKTSEAFSLLRRRLDEIPELKQYRASREDARQLAAKAELDEAVDTAHAISGFSESYARRNITADNAQDVLKLKASLSEALAAPDTSSLKLAISAAETQLDRLHLTSEYQEYRTKHPIQSKKSLPATTDRNRLIVDGPLDETLILVNESGRSGVVRNIRGELVFDRGQASLCFLHDNGLDAFGISELKRKIIEKGARTVTLSGVRCSTDAIDSFDTIALNRGLFSTLAPDMAKAVLTKVDKGEFTLLDSLSDRELQVARNGAGIKSLQIENELLKRTIDGFGVVALANGTSIVCQTVPDRQKAHEALVNSVSDRFAVELGAHPKVISTSIESAFVSAKRGQCGAVYGSAKDLRDLIAGLQRDKLAYRVMPVWFAPTEVDDEQKLVVDAEARTLREQQAVEQKRKDDQIRVAIQRRQTDAERKERQVAMQKESGGAARALQDSMTDEVKKFTAAADLSAGAHVRQKWPELTAWYRNRIAEDWQLEDVLGDLRDYGQVKWKDRILEAGFVAITFKMKNRALGEHQQKCFVVGYVDDREFEVARDPLAVPCDDEVAVGRYKTAHEFSSKWIAN